MQRSELKFEFGDDDDVFVDDDDFDDIYIL